jgi:hypothetical protein
MPRVRFYFILLSKLLLLIHTIVAVQEVSVKWLWNTLLSSFLLHRFFVGQWLEVLQLLSGTRHMCYLRHELLGFLSVDGAVLVNRIFFSNIIEKCIKSPLSVSAIFANFIRWHPCESLVMLHELLVLDDRWDSFNVGFLEVLVVLIVLHSVFLLYSSVFTYCFDWLEVRHSEIMIAVDFVVLNVYSMVITVVISINWRVRIHRQLRLRCTLGLHLLQIFKVVLTHHLIPV